MLRIYRVEHNGEPRYVADREGAWRLIDGDVFGTFTEGTETYQDAAGLMHAIADSEQAHLCYSKRLASYGLQRDVVPADVPWLTKLAAASQAEGGSIKQVILELVKSEAFRSHLGGAP